MEISFVIKLYNCDKRSEKRLNLSLLSDIPQIQPRGRGTYGHNLEFNIYFYEKRFKSKILNGVEANNKYVFKQAQNLCIDASV